MVGDLLCVHTASPACLPSMPTEMKGTPGESEWRTLERTLSSGGMVLGSLEVTLRVHCDSRQWPSQAPAHKEWGVDVLKNLIEEIPV